MVHTACLLNQFAPLMLPVDSQATSLQAFSTLQHVRALKFRAPLATLTPRILLKVFHLAIGAEAAAASLCLCSSAQVPTLPTESCPWQASGHVQHATFLQP